MPESRLSAIEVGEALRALRVASDYPRQETVAAQIKGLSQAALSRYERGSSYPPRKHLTALLDLYRADRGTRDRLAPYAREDQPEPKRVTLHRAPAIQQEIGLRERRAVRIDTFCVTVVPGLLQSERYTRALGEGGLSGQRLERWLGRRRARRALLEEPGREFRQLVYAGALLWGLGGPEVMREQLDHLVDRSRLPSVQLGVIPLGTTIDVTVMNNFDIYHDEHGPDAVIAGSTTGGAALVENVHKPRRIVHEDVTRHAVLFDQLGAAAVWGEAARGAIHDLRQSYYVRGTTE